MQSITLSTKRVRGSIWEIVGDDDQCLFELSYSTTRGSTAVMARSRLPLTLAYSIDKGDHEKSLDAAIAECGKALDEWMRRAFGLTVQVAILCEE